MSILVWLLVGLIAGWLAGMITKGGGYGIIGDIVLGLLGGLVGGWLFGAIVPGTEPSGFVGAVIVSAIGAVILVALSRLIGGRPVRA